MELSILVPVLQRPGNILPLLDSIAAATSCEYEVLVLVSTNDRVELRALEAVYRSTRQLQPVVMRPFEHRIAPGLSASP